MEDTIIFIVIVLSALCVPLWLVLNFKKQRSEQKQAEQMPAEQDKNTDIYDK